MKSFQWKKKLFTDSDILRISSICHIQRNQFLYFISLQFLYNFSAMSVSSINFAKLNSAPKSAERNNGLLLSSFPHIFSQKGSLKAHIKNNMRKMFYKFTLLGSILSDTQWQLQKQKKCIKKHCFFSSLFFLLNSHGF